MFFGLFKDDNKKTAADCVADGNKLLFDGILDALESSKDFKLYDVVPYESFTVRAKKNIIYVKIIQSNTDVGNNITVFADRTGTFALTDRNGEVIYNNHHYETSLSTIKVISLLQDYKIATLMRNKSKFNAVDMDNYNY